MIVTEGCDELDGLVILSCRHESAAWRDSAKHEVLQQCRGAIFEKASGRAVCVPFGKFYNVNEARAARLDWDAGVVAEEKIDGCLLKLFHWGGEWRLASNRQLDVDAVDGKYRCTGRTNRELFDEAAAASGLDYSRLDPRCAYMFERVHPDFRIVVEYDAPALWHIGTRDMHTLAEVHGDDIGVRRPRHWLVRSLGECRLLMGEHSDIGEGLVLRQAAGERRAVEAVEGAAATATWADQWPNRLKLKRAEYVWLHDCSCGGGRTGAAFDTSWVARCGRIGSMDLDRACFSVWLRGEESEFAAYYPDLHRRYARVAAAMDGLLRAGGGQGAGEAAAPRRPAESERLAEAWDECSAEDPRERREGRFVHEERLWEALQRALSGAK